MTRRTAFTQQDVTRAIKGAQRAGFAVDCVKIAPDGTITISASGDTQQPRANSWDD